MAIKAFVAIIFGAVRLFRPTAFHICNSVFRQNHSGSFVWILKKKDACLSDILLLFGAGRYVAMKGCSTSRVDGTHKRLQYVTMLNEMKLQ
jgi:hypothetical protein